MEDSATNSEETKDVPAPTTAVAAEAGEGNERESKSNDVDMSRDESVAINPFAGGGIAAAAAAAAAKRLNRLNNDFHCSSKGFVSGV